MKILFTVSILATLWCSSTAAAGTAFAADPTVEEVKADAGGFTESDAFATDVSTSNGGMRGYAPVVEDDTTKAKAVLNGGHKELQGEEEVSSVADQKALKDEVVAVANKSVRGGRVDADVDADAETLGTDVAVGSKHNLPVGTFVIGTADEGDGVPRYLKVNGCYNGVRPFLSSYAYFDTNGIASDDKFKWYIGKWPGSTPGYYIKSKFCERFGHNKVLDISGGKCNNGKPILLWQSNGNWNQRWNDDTSSDSVRELVPNKSTCTKEITIQGGANAQGKELVLWKDNKDDHQKWFFYNPDTGIMAGCKQLGESCGWGKGGCCSDGYCNGSTCQARRTHDKSCDAVKKCASGLNCHPGVHKCYNVPREFDEPCSAGYNCGSGLSCAGGNKCKHDPRWEGEPCTTTSDCDASVTDSRGYTLRCTSSFGGKCEYPRDKEPGDYCTSDCTPSQYSLSCQADPPTGYTSGSGECTHNPPIVGERCKNWSCMENPPFYLFCTPFSKICSRDNPCSSLSQLDQELNERRKAEEDRYKELVDEIAALEAEFETAVAVSRFISLPASHRNLQAHGLSVEDVELYSRTEEYCTTTSIPADLTGLCDENDPTAAHFCDDANAFDGELCSEVTVADMTIHDNSALLNQKLIELEEQFDVITEIHDLSTSTICGVIVSAVNAIINWVEQAIQDLIDFLDLYKCIIAQAAFTAMGMVINTAITAIPGLGQAITALQTFCPAPTALTESFNTAGGVAITFNYFVRLLETLFCWLGSQGLSLELFEDACNCMTMIQWFAQTIISGMCGNLGTVIVTLLEPFLICNMWDCGEVLNLFCPFSDSYDGCSTSGVHELEGNIIASIASS